MKYTQIVLLSFFFFGLFFSTPAHGQQDNENNFLTTLVQSKNYSQLKAYTSDALFLYQIEGEKLCVYAQGNQTKPIQILTKDSGYAIKKPFAMTLSATEDKIVILSQQTAKILTFKRNTKTGFLELEEEKTF